MNPEKAAKLKANKKHRQTKYLIQGMETTSKITCLLAGTKIDSERKIKALYYHFVDGAEICNAASAFHLPQPNLTDVIEALNKVAGVCEKYHELKLHERSKYTS